MRIILLPLLFILPSPLLAQLGADFIPDKTGGCSPLAISFTNTTSGASSTATYQWDLGNGNASSLQTASAIYYQEKTYSITLTVRDGAQVSTQTKTITVYKRPSLDFNVSDAKGCIPFTASFSSSSSPGDGAIAAYHWDFGDGTIQQSSSPAILHTYDFVQAATVSLTAVNSYGCSNSLIRQNMITAIPPVTADFVADQTTHCNAPATVRFTNRSNGPGVLSYTWDFGDGTNATGASPSHTYTTKGRYTVRLLVKSSEGCSNEMTRAALINVADFTTDFEVPTLICTDGYTSFRNTSSPTPDQSTWMIDGSGSYPYYGGYSFPYTFSAKGMHTVELINTFGTCQQSTIKQVEIRERPALNGFIADIAGLCGAPVQVNFKDTTGGAISWQWNFNYYYNNSVIHSTLKAPAYTYTSDNLYYTALTVANAAGCTSTVVQPVGISRPLIGIFPEPDNQDEGCVPVTTKLSARFTEAITSYDWNFGDGQRSSEASPVHIYTQAGVYTVSLHYTTVNGCTGTVNYYTTIRVRQKPKAGFSVQPQVCGNTPVQFINTTTGYVNNYMWNYGDSPFNDYSGNHQYQAAGEYNVMLIAYNGMCNDTITRPAVIKVLSPFAKIGGAVNTCEGTRGLVVFRDDSREADSWRWDFGDGNTLSYATARTQVDHNYTRSGSYKVVLAVTNGNCIVKDSLTVYVLLKQNPLLTANASSICVEGGSLSIKVDGLSKFVLPSNYYVPPYYWHKFFTEDGNALNCNISDVYPYNNLPWTPSLSGFHAGTEKFRVISQSVYFNCYDTTNYISVKINGPSAALRVNTGLICYKSLASFEDLSTSRDNVPIVKWEWRFGDGQTVINSRGGPVTHRYSDPGVYYVTLSVTDANGCHSTITGYDNPVSVTGPKASFSPSGTNVQLNTTVNFYNSTNAYNTMNATYAWDFGNGVTSTGFSPSYTYTVAGEYTITLIATNAQTQCADTARRTIIVKNFNTGFSTSTSLIGDRGNCPPVLVRFNNTSTNYTRLVWDFGDGASLENRPYPNHIYTRPGRYIVTLCVYGYNGLSDTYTDTILVNRPQATIGADDIEGCIGHQLTLNAPSHTSAASYAWDFGNGYVENAADSFATHQYPDAGVYTASLLVEDATGCLSSVELPDKIVIHADPVVTISPAVPVSCKGAAVQLQASGGTSYNWTPAVGLTASGIDNPLSAPAATTTYSVAVSDVNGCRGSGSVTVTVPTPFTMSVSPDADVCKGSSIQLQASGADSYQWINATAGLDNTGIADPVANPQDNIMYTVMGHDAYQCYADTKDIHVAVRSLPLVDAGPDREVVYGSENVLKINYSNDVTRWNWTPADFLNCTKCPAPVSRPYATMDYTVTVFNNYNCSAKDSIRLKAVCTDGNVYIPNAFTPNNDGTNDLFTINGYGVSKIRSFRIYNRWGEVIFQKKEFLPNDNTAVWNGRFKGMDAPAGVYVYFIEMECEQGEKFERKGVVTLVR